VHPIPFAGLLDARLIARSIQPLSGHSTSPHPGLVHKGLAITEPDSHLIVGDPHRDADGDGLSTRLNQVHCNGEQFSELRPIASKH